MTQHVDIHIKIRLKGADIDDADTKRAVEYHTAGLVEALLLARVVTAEIDRYLEAQRQEVDHA